MNISCSYKLFIIFCLWAAIIIPARSAQTDQVEKPSIDRIKSATRDELINGDINQQIHDYWIEKPDESKPILEALVVDIEERVSNDPSDAELWAKKGYTHFRIALIPGRVYSEKNPHLKKKDHRSYLINNSLYKKHIHLANESYRKSLEIARDSEEQPLSYSSISGMTSSQTGAAIETRVSAARYLVENEVLPPDPPPEEDNRDYITTEAEHRYDNYSRLVGTLVAAHRYDEAREVLREMKKKADELSAGRYEAFHENGILGILDESLKRIDKREALYREAKAGKEEQDGERNNGQKDDESSGGNGDNLDSFGNPSSIEEDELRENDSMSSQEQSTLSNREGEEDISDESQVYRISTSSIIAVGILIIVLVGAGFLVIRARRNRGNNVPR